MSLHTDTPLTKGVSPETPYLSHSRVNRYLHCPEQYRPYYVERLRPRIPDAALIFGQLMHQALAQFFRTGADPADSFANGWELLRNEPLNYNLRDSWEILRARGIALLTKFLHEEAPRLGNITAIEQSFTLRITSLDLALVGVIDLVAELDDVRTVIDFKTAVAAYQDHDVQLSDQLTAYQLAEPEAEQVALCVFVRTKEPRIDWYISARQPAHLAEYLAKAGVVHAPSPPGTSTSGPAGGAVTVISYPSASGTKRKSTRRWYRLRHDSDSTSPLRSSPAGSFFHIPERVDASHLVMAPGQLAAFCLSLAMIVSCQATLGGELL